MSFARPWSLVQAAIDRVGRGGRKFNFWVGSEVVGRLGTLVQMIFFARPWSLVQAAIDRVGCRILTFWQAPPSSTRLRRCFSCVLPTAQDRSQQATRVIMLRARFYDLHGRTDVGW
eukprot:gene23722-biopygen19357